MIKFIACDLDGTLLNSKKEMPTELKQTVERLNQIGVVFAPASGRQYYKVLEQFEPICPGLMYIAENGAYVVKDGKVLVCDCLSGKTAAGIIQKSRELSNVYTILCCEDCAYIEDDEALRAAEVGKYYKRIDTVGDLLDLCETKKILKIALYAVNDAYTEIYKNMTDFEDRAQVILSGKNWVDIMKGNVSKGTAIKKIRQVCGFEKDECMCFGDYLNDYEMMFECGESYAMENAHEDLKKVAKHIAPSNDDNGVIRTIQKLF